MRRMLRPLLLLLASSAVIAGAAHAQPPEDGSDGGGRTRFEARRAERARALHAALGLRADQEADWTAYQAALQPEPHDAAPPPATAPERADAAVTRAQGRLDSERRRAAAVKAFYARLTPAQRQAFDTAEPAGGRGGYGRRGEG